MENPNLRHFREGYVFSDPIDALVGETWIKAIYTNEGWFTPDLATKLVAVTEWRYATEERQQQSNHSGKHQAGDQGRQVTRTSGRNRVRKGRQNT